METLVFLHGGGARPENYQALLDSLSKKYKVNAPVLYDLVETKDFSWRKFAKNLDKLIGNKKVYLVGSSLGGGLSLAYAAFYPHKVKAVIACESVGAGTKRNLIVWAFLLLKMSTRALFYSGGLRVGVELRCTLINVLVTTNFKRIYSLLKMVYEQDLEEFLPRIKVPVYLLWSKNSGVLPLEMGERLDQRIKTSFFNPNFSDKNHLWCLLEQEKVAQEVRKILADISTRGERGEKITNTQ